MEAARGPLRGRDEPMPEHYAAATAPSVLIVEKVLEETDRIIDTRYKVKEEPDV